MSGKTRLRDLIAATSLVILLKIGFKSIFGPCNLEIWWMTSKNNMTPLLYYIKLCASFQSHQSIQTGVTVRKHSIRVKISDFFAHVTSKIRWMALKKNKAPLLYYIKLCASFQSHRWIQTRVSPETLNLGQNQRFSVPCDLEIWWMALKNKRAPLLCYFQLCASFHSHL